MAAPYTIPQIISIAKVSQYLANDKAAKGALFGKVIDPQLGTKIYVTRKDVEQVYNLNPNYAGLQEAANYLYSLCNPAAWGIVNGGSGGGTVTPGQVSLIKSPIMITGSMFNSALSWTGANNDGLTILSSYTLQVFWNGLNRFLVTGTEFNRTALGFDIINNGTTISGFNALTTNAADIFYVFISA